MKKLIPKAEAIIAFLKLKGWKVTGKLDGYYILAPASDIEPKDFEYKIPYYEEEYTYPIVAQQRVYEIADFYGWDRVSLMKLLSQNTEDIEELLKSFFAREGRTAKAS